MAKIKVKKGAVYTPKTPIRRIEWLIIKAYNIVDPWVKPVITSGNDGKHMMNSLHYVDLAADYRTRDFQDPNEKYIFKRLVKHLIEELIYDGDNYDVVLERDHLHVEYDPK